MLSRGGTKLPMPPMLCCQLAALVIAGMYYTWRDVINRPRVYPKLVRERVAYMLWVAAQR